MTSPVSEPFNAEVSFGDVMGRYCESLNARLLSEEAFYLINRHADLFPLYLSPFFCFEIPLFKEEKTSDFLFCISNPVSCNEYFNKLNWPAKNGISASSLYKGIKDFSLCWNAGNAGPFNQVVNIWFEYDYDDMNRGVSAPNFFFAPRSGMNAIMTVHITDMVFKTISGRHLSRETGRYLLECLYNLPEKGWVSQIGKMFARDEDNLRLFIQQIPPRQIYGYLQKTGYQHANNVVLVALLNNCYALADQVDLDIDITDCIGETIGLECSFDNIGKALNFLDFLVAEGLCPPQKYQLLYTFLEGLHYEPGKDYQAFLSHFKLVFHPYKKVKVKAYIGWVSNQSAGRTIRTKHF